MEVSTLRARVFAPSVAQELGHPWTHELMEAQWFLSGDGEEGVSLVRSDIAIAMERETRRLAWLLVDADLKEQSARELRPHAACQAPWHSLLFETGVSPRSSQ